MRDIIVVHKSEVGLYYQLLRQQQEKSRVILESSRIKKKLVKDSLAGAALNAFAAAIKPIKTTFESFFLHFQVQLIYQTLLHKSTIPYNYVYGRNHMLKLYVWQESRICPQWTLTWLDVFDMCLCSLKLIHSLILYTVLFSLYAGLTQHHEFETLINMSIF